MVARRFTILAPTSSVTQSTSRGHHSLENSAHSPRDPMVNQLMTALNDLPSPGIGFHWTLIWAKFMAVRVSYATEERYEH